MKRRSRDEEREQRITMEIVVDAYTPEEQAMGWYYSLEDRLHFPFVARCIAERSISPLRARDEVEVVEASFLANLWQGTADGGSPRVTASNPCHRTPSAALPRQPGPADRRGRPLSGGMKTMMKFATSYNTAYYGVDPDKIVAYAQHAEACGFEALYLPEHIVLYPGARVGSTEIPPSLPIADPLACLSFVAAATRRILLGTGILLLPYHHPVVLAKRLATIDVLSKGRMRLLTVGVGTLPGEARAVGVAFGTRGRRADEAIDVLRLLWAGGEDGVSFEGEFFAFDNLCSFPKPYGVTHLPIHIGGSSRAAARRAGRRGDGYFPGGALSPHERGLQMDLARSTAVEVARDPEALEYTRWGSIGMPIERVEAFAAQGVTRIVVAATATDADEQREELSAFAQRFGLLDRLT